MRVAIANCYRIQQVCLIVVALAATTVALGQADENPRKRWPRDGSCFQEIMCSPVRTPDGVAIAPQLNNVFHYDEIQAETIADLARAFDIKGHKGAPGWVSAEVIFDFKSRNDADMCRIVEERATCNSTTHVPKWVNPKKASARAQSWWNDSFGRLTKHEEDHVKTCAELAADVERPVWATPAANECRLVDLNARNRGIRIIEKMNYLQMKYDKCEYDIQPPR